MHLNQWPEGITAIISSLQLSVCAGVCGFVCACLCWELGVSVCVCMCLCVCVCLDDGRWELERFMMAVKETPV